MFFSDNYFIKIFLILIFFNLKAEEKIETIYGTAIVKEQVIIDLINDKYMQRLKDINQYGIDYYVYKPEEYSRYEHSLGVFFLVRKYGADLKEQIAALLHDVSHTAFSHVGDFLFNKAEDKDSYQDSIHYKFIKSSSLKNVLKKHGYKVKDIIHKNGNFKCLEADIPDICADRLEYNLFGGFLENLLTIEDINNILENLKFEDKRWFFTDIDIANKFADITIYLSKYRWADPKTIVINTLTVNLLKKALEIKLINIEDILYGSDSQIWFRLINSDNNLIKKELNKLLNFRSYYQVNNKDFDICLKPKCRAVDPFIKLDNNFFRLSEVDEKYKLKLEEIKKYVSSGIYIKLI